MSAHEFVNTPILVVVLTNRSSHYENYCQCGFRAHASTKQEMLIEQGDHLNLVSTIVAEHFR